MDQMHATHTTEYHFGESFAGAVRTVLAAELLLTGFLRLLSSEFAGWDVAHTDFVRLQWLLVSAIVLFEVVAPACGRYRLFLYAGIEAGLLGLGGWYAYRELASIRDGGVGLCNDYLQAWNIYYKTNYLVSNAKVQVGVGLGFFVVVLALLFLVIYYVTGARWLMLVPSFAALTLGLLVNRCPSWEGLMCVLMGTMVLYSGGADSSRVLFVPVKHGKRRIPPAVMQLVSTLAVLALSLLVVVMGQRLFEEPAEKIPDQAPKFMAFQKQVEVRVEELVSSLNADSDAARVDNGTPTYRDKLVMTITTDEMPASNLYLPEFYSGTYRDGKWESESEVYRSAAEAAQIDRDRLGTLLYQMGYESFDAVSYYASIANRNMDRWNYTISYERTGSAACLPYFSDLSETDDTVWVEGEGLVKKERGEKELSFRGWNNNTNVLQLLFDMSHLDSDNQSQADMINWYSAYVMEHYRNASSLPAVQDASGSIAEQVIAESGGAWPSVDTEDVIGNNLCRIGVAGYVQRAMGETAQYNLYLDDIPAGTDTIQYFLETGHEGYCMHFASAGALILQDMGIPARYASGYFVKQSAFRKAADGTYSAKVYDRNSHAWVEIYLEGIGWVPVEMTPGYEYVGGGLPTDADKQEELKEQHENKNEDTEDALSSDETETGSEDTENTESENTETEETEYSVPQEETEEKSSANGEDETEGAAGKRFLLLGKILAGVVICTAFIVLCVLGISVFVRRYQEILWQELRHHQNRRAVKRINRRIYRRLMRKGRMPIGHVRFPKQGSGTAGLEWIPITDAEYESRLARAYEMISPEEWKEYMRIVKKAAFSVAEVCDDEAQFCYGIYRKLDNKR